MPRNQDEFVLTAIVIAGWIFGLAVLWEILWVHSTTH
jgi:hypothetical protein